MDDIKKDMRKYLTRAKKILNYIIRKAVRWTSQQITVGREPRE